MIGVTSSAGSAIITVAPLIDATVAAVAAEKLVVACRGKSDVGAMPKGPA